MADREHTYAVQLTLDEVSALRVAAIFGGSKPQAPSLKSAVAKLSALKRRITPREEPLRDLPEVAEIAYCPEHGLHGCRTHCFECGRPVEQIRMRLDIECAKEQSDSPIGRYHPDSEINAGVAADVLEAERFDLSVGSRPSHPARLHRAHRPVSDGRSRVG